MGLHGERARSGGCYRLTINPADANQYLLDGKWRDFEKSDAKIRVKIWGPLIWTVHRDVLWAEQARC